MRRGGCCNNCSALARVGGRRQKRVGLLLFPTAPNSFAVTPSTTSTGVDPDVLIFAMGYLACFMDTTAEGLTVASFSPNHPESEA